MSRGIAGASLPEAAAAERMDRIYRHQRFIYDLTRKYYLLGRDRLLAELEPHGGHVLEVGCGTGRNLCVAARRYPAARFYGIDVSAEMLDTAHAAFTRAGLAGKVTTARADATTFDARAAFGRETFDRIFFSYTLSMIPDWPAVLERAASTLARGGKLMIVDFGQQDGLPGWFRRLLFGWLALFHVHPAADLTAALQDLAERNDMDLRQRKLFRGYALFASLTKV